MTSKNSFWDSCRENHKRRIWVWIVAVLGQLTAYVGFLMVYLSRIRMRYAQGVYYTFEEYHDVMCRATLEALGFQDRFIFTIIGLAAIIGIQGFSYLHDRRKVDLYHSVPLDKNRRFLAVYLNGIIIYLVSTVISMAAGIALAFTQDAVNGLTLSGIGIAFIWNLLFFLVIYHTVILAVMFTGNWLVTICLAGVFAGYEIILYELHEDIQYAYFETVSRFYTDQAAKLSVVYDYYMKITDLRYLAGRGDIGRLVREILPYYGKWSMLAVAILAAAWLCYRKRPSEAAGKAIAFVKAEPVLKILIAIPASVGIGMIINHASYGSTLLTAIGMLAGGVIICAAVEVVYDFDIKSMVKHPVSGAVALVGIMIVFLIYKNDLLGYDKYVPLESQVDSIALNLDVYGEHWKEDFSYLSVEDFHKEHMFITDVESVLTLAAKSQHERERFETFRNMTDTDNTPDIRVIPVLYRLKSGREVERKIWIDYANPANETLLNRIVSSDEFKTGNYQVMTDRDSFDQVQAMDYSNGAAVVALWPEDAQKLRDAYVKDMEKFDFSLAIEERPCGRVIFVFPNQRYTRLYVYESFENTIAYLKEQGAYYPVQLNPEDIADVTIKNYHYELEEGIFDSLAEYNLAMGASASAVAQGASLDRTVMVTFDDEEDFAQIVPAIYPSNFTAMWHNDSLDMDENYDIRITFKRDTSYPYDKSDRVFYYKFYAGQVPDFVEEATAYHADTE